MKLRFERKGRSGGQGVTLIEGLQADPFTLDNLLSELKKALGRGGTRRGRVLEIQGDAREALSRELASRGFSARG